MSDLEKLVLDVLPRPQNDKTSDLVIADVINKATPYSSRAVEEGLGNLARQLEQLRTVNQAQVDAVADNTQAIAQNTQVQTSQGGSTVGDIARGASKVLGGGLGFTPLLTGLIGLFRKEKAEPLPPLTPFYRPPALQVESVLGEVAGRSLIATDYEQNDVPRPIQQSGASYSPQITVQVQAIDSRSFLDHSSEIARAVREAMLSAHPLNDMINEL